MHTHKLTALCFAAALAAGACGPKSGTPGSTQPPTGVGGPGGQDTAFPQEEFRAAQPAPSEPRPFNLPVIKQFKLADQIDVYLVERHDLPTVSMELNFEGGSVNDPGSKNGMASVCLDMMSEGTKKLEKIAFNEALADLASGVSSYAGSETQGVSMRSLSKNFDATFALFSETVTQPGFRKEDLDRLIARSLESLKQAKGSPQPVAGRVASSILYGPRHPLGSIETEKTLKSIKINDCRAYHRSYIKPKGARLFVVGDMTEDKIKSTFGPLLKSWKGTPKKSTKIGEPQSRKGKVFFVNIPGSAQSTIYIAHFGPKRSAHDFFANDLMTAVLGGGFASRINMNLREDKGYSYGARGGFRYNRHFGSFYAASSVRSDATRQSLLEVFGEIDGMKSGNKPATSAELGRETNGMILSLPGNFATSRQTLSMYRTLVYFGLPLDYYNTYVAKVQGVTPEQVANSATTHLNPEGSMILVVGDGSVPQIVRNEDGGKDDQLTNEDKPVTLLDALEDLSKSEVGGKGALVIMDADGKVLESK